MDPRRNSPKVADCTAGLVRHAPTRRTPADWTPTQRLKNLAICLGVRAAIKLADRLPPCLLFALGRACGLAAYQLLPQARATAHANLTRIMPLEAERLKMLCFVRLGENLATTLVLRRPGVRALDLVHLPQQTRELMTATLAEGRGAIFVSAHLGPFELVAAAFAELGHRPAIVVRESR